MFIPGSVISVATFPGVMVHEMAHVLFCRLFRVAVGETCYFRFGTPSGYVLHETPSAPAHHVLIGIGPFVLNSVLGAAIAFPAAIPIMQFGSGTSIDYLVMWFGVSVAMHAFPSTGDAQSIWEALKEPATPIALKILGAPVVGLIYAGAVGSIVWLDLAYGFLVAGLLPGLLVYVMA